MPRTADHDLRRDQIAESAFGLIAHAGLEAATMAAVAREAGFSVGLVQHYFESKDDLLLFAYRRTMDAQLERAFRLVAEGEANRGRIDEILLVSLQELWPLDQRRRDEYRMTRAFHARSLVSPSVAESARTAAATMRGLIAQAVENGKECGEVTPGTAADTAAARIAALTDGLADQLYREPDLLVDGRSFAETASAMLRSDLAATFPGECRRYR